MLDGGIGADLALAEQGDQGGVHQVVALRAGGGDGIGDLGGLALADQIADRRGDGHDLGGQNAATAAVMGQELLADNGLQAHGKLHPDLGLLLCGENIHDAVNGVRSGVGMQGGEDQMARLGRDQRRLDGGQGAHFANQDHIRVLPEDGLQAVGVGAGILTHLTLVDDALVGGIDVLDGIFQRDDVLALGMIDLVQQAGQSGGLAGAGLAGDQDDALLEFREIRDLRRKSPNTPLSKSLRFEISTLLCSARPRPQLSQTACEPRYQPLAALPTRTTV